MAGFWKNRFIDDGTVLTWNEALARFRDATGQPGPAKWRNGTFAEGEADFPVMGVSWFEAAAYAEFAGNGCPPLTIGGMPPRPIWRRPWCRSATSAGVGRHGSAAIRV